MSKFSVWRCFHCQVLLKTKGLMSIGNYLGFLTVTIPSYILLFVFKVRFLIAIFVALALLGMVYLAAVFYYYYTTVLEEVD